MRSWMMAVIPLAAAALLLPCLTGHRILAGFDHLAIWYPFMTYAQAGYQETGMLPQWIRQIFGGMPLGASLVPSLYYPTDLLCWLLGIPVHWFYTLDTAVHLTLAGFGVIRLARTFGLSMSAGLIGGLAYMFSGYFMTQMNVGTVVFIRGAAWLPWIFWAAQRAVDSGTARPWITLGALLSLLPLTACYQLFAYLVLVLPAFVWATSPPARRSRTLFALAVTGMLAVTLAALTILPAARYFLASMRADSATDWSSMEPFLSAEIPGLLVRDLFGHNPKTKYPGIVVLLLATLGATQNWQKAWLWLLLGAAGLLLALGPATPAGVLFAWLPLWGSFRISSHWILIFQLAAAMLCALGAERICSQSLPGRTKSLKHLASIGLALGMILGGAALGHRAIWEQIQSTAWVKERMAHAKFDEGSPVKTFGKALGLAAGRSLTTAGVAAALAAIPASSGVALAVFSLGIAADLVVTGGPHPNTLVAAEFAKNDPVKSPLIRTLQALPGPFRIYTEESHILVNYRIPAGLEWVKGYHGAPLAKFARFYDHAIQCPDLPNIFAWLNVRYYLTRDLSRFPSLIPRSRFTSEDGQGYWICEDPAALPRVFFAQRTKPAVSDEMTLSLLCAAPPGRREVFITIPPAASSHAGQVLSVSRGADSIQAEVEASKPGLVVFSEVDYPAWSAFVDGIRQPIIPVNVLLRGIAVGPGRHRIEMAYDSIVFKLGLWLTFASWVALAGCLAIRLKAT